MHQEGFSFTEVLCALLLTSTLLLVLLKQNWQLSRLINDEKAHNKALLLMGNVSESLLAGQKLPPINKPYSLRQKRTNNTVTLQLQWPTFDSVTSNNQLLRQLHLAAS